MILSSLITLPLLGALLLVFLPQATERQQRFLKYIAFAVTLVRDRNGQQA